MYVSVTVRVRCCTHFFLVVAISEGCSNQRTLRRRKDDGENKSVEEEKKERRLIQQKTKKEMLYILYDDLKKLKQLNGVTSCLKANFDGRGWPSHPQTVAEPGAGRWAGCADVVTDR